MICQFADLFHECDRPAAVVMQWKRWGEIAYCASHHSLLSSSNPPDLISVSELGRV